MLKIISALLIITLSQQCKDIPSSESKAVDLITPVPLADLPKKLDESSGLEIIDGYIFSVNDSGGKPELFVFDEKGNALDKIKIKNAKNNDWESLAANNQHFFIADIGNNSGNREDLTIYYFPLTDLKKEKVHANQIKFKYGNQPHYKHKKKKHSFDGEAMIALDSTLVIFSKDWLNYTTQVYHLPILHPSENLESLPTEELPIDALITGADYDSESQKLVLCGYKNNHNYLWVFSNAQPHKLLTSTYTNYVLEGLHGAQVEGIAFRTSNEVVISTEKTKEFKQQLWRVRLTP